MINPISIANIKNNKNFNYKNQNISFGKNITESTDIYISGETEFNSQNILQALKDKDFSDALELLKIALEDFDPNYHDKNGMSLLGALYGDNEPLNKRKAKELEQCHSDIIARIVDHPAFDPNYPYKDSARNTCFYIEDAVKFNDTYLAIFLEKLNTGIFDPYSDSFATLHDRAKSPVIKHMLDKLAVHLKHAVATTETAVDSAQDTFEESQELSPYRVYLSDSIPDSLDCVGGMKEAKIAVNDFIIRPWNPEIKRKLRENNIELPNGFLMYGPPGCGKTYLAKIIAKQTGFPLYEIDLSSVGDSLAYKTANNLKKIFLALESQYRKNNVPSILFLDEIDSIASSRKSVTTDWKRDDINTLISLLNNASEKGIIAIAATNLLDNVDEAVLRPGRFDKKIQITLPSKEERAEILRQLIINKKVAVSLYDISDELAKLTEGKTCSELNAILNDCCRRAIYSGKNSVSKEDFIASIKQIENQSEGHKEIIGFRSFYA